MHADGGWHGLQQLRGECAGGAPRTGGSAGRSRGCGGDTGIVTYAEGKLATEVSAGELAHLGYRVKEGRPITPGGLRGMDYADEVRLIEGKFGHLSTVAKLAFDVVNRRLTVEGEITSSDVERAVAQLGTKAPLVGEEREEVS